MAGSRHPMYSLLLKMTCLLVYFEAKILTDGFPFDLVNAVNDIDVGISALC